MEKSKAYTFEIKHTEYRTVEIQAESKEQAREIVEKLLNHSIGDFNSMFWDEFGWDELEICSYHGECDGKWADFRNGKWDDVFEDWAEEE